MPLLVGFYLYYIYLLCGFSDVSTGGVSLLSLTDDDSNGSSFCLSNDMRLSIRSSRQWSWNEKQVNVSSQK